MKPHARHENGAWLVWCADIGPSPRQQFIEAYRAWKQRKEQLIKVEIGI